MGTDNEWFRLDRKLAYDSKFLKVYEDTIKLPNGKVIDDYTLVELPTVVMVVATDIDGRLIVLREYKYAAGETMLTLPAGHKEADESPIAAAQRELLEETGYAGGEFQELITLRDYPTKSLHKLHVIRATNVSRQTDAQHEETELISFELLFVAELKQQILDGQWKSSSALAALAVSGILY